MNRLYESSSRPLASESKRILHGLFAELETFNQNDRTYPKAVYLPALEKLMPKIKEGRLLGECDHPEYDEVRLANVSHVIRECRVVGNKVYGKIELLDTPSGKILQALNEAGVPIGISSRGFGDTRRLKEGSEVTSLELITYDAVADPSFNNAILTESAKATLRNRLDDIEKTLPLNESKGDSPIRTKISNIRESLDNSPTITSTLVESVGKLTIEKEELSNKLKDTIIRNKSIRENMSILQDSYNKLSNVNKNLELKLREAESSYDKDLSDLKNSYNKDIKSLKESHIKEIKSLKDSYEDEIVTLRKELAIEKRGLSKESIMPILEGLKTQSDIDEKLDSLKRIKYRRYESIPSNESIILTEGNSGNRRLSSIISKV